MIVNLTIPRVGVNVIEFRLVEWNACEGDWVEIGSEVLFIETEKTQWAIEAEISGFLHILVDEGQKAEVGSIVGQLSESKEEYESLQVQAQGKSLTPEPKETARPGEANLSVSHSDAVGLQGEGKKIRIFITPAARKMAEKHKIDLHLIKGSGPGGRVNKRDVEAAIEKKEKSKIQPALYHGRRVRRSEAIKGVRESIAEHMFRSLSTTAQMSVMGKLDMMEIVRVREDLLKEEKETGIRISFIDIQVFIVARALKKNRSINCSLIDGEIMFWEDINVGVAVALGEEGLIVPVIKNADKKTLMDISLEVKALRQKAGEKKLMPDEVTGGTFTLSTVGRGSISRFQTPILNEPEAAILSTGAIEESAVVRTGEIVIRPIMPFSFTFDHRIINGFGGEQFLRTIREFVERPNRLFLY